MAALAFLLAAIEFALVGFGVEFPTDTAIQNVAVGLFLIALGLLLPGAIVLYEKRQG